MDDSTLRVDSQPKSAGLAWYRVCIHHINRVNFHCNGCSTNNISVNVYMVITASIIINNDFLSPKTRTEFNERTFSVTDHSHCTLHRLTKT